jgi:hypothetical protein
MLRSRSIRWNWTKGIVERKEFGILGWLANLQILAPDTGLRVATQTRAKTEAYCVQGLTRQNGRENLWQLIELVVTGGSAGAS